MMKGLPLVSMGMLGMVAAGCASSVPTAGGNSDLGIARFDTDETASTTRVVGFDAQGREVGRLELVHGTFALTGIFRDDYETAQVDGRKLDIDVRGQQLVWETAGYAPALSLPAHPPSHVALARFVDDPHVRSVLDRWQIGFETSATLEGDAAYTSGSIAGSFVASCANQTTCGPSVRGNSANTCGGGAAALQAVRINSYGVADEDLIAQCCPTGSGGQSTGWFAQKRCPGLSTNLDTACGTASSSAACKGCPEYPANAEEHCSIWYSGGTLYWDYQPTLPCSSNYDCTPLGGSFYCPEEGGACRPYDSGICARCGNGNCCEEQSVPGHCDETPTLSCPTQ